VSSSSPYDKYSHKISAMRAVMTDIGLHPRMRVEWLDSRRAVEDALSDLPKSVEWPGVYETLAESMGVAKRAEVVLDRGNLVALILLRCAASNTWQLATNWIIPGFLFPACPGYTYMALENIPQTVHVGWWRIDDPTPVGPRMFDLKETPTHRMDCAADPEIYWKESGNLKFLRHARHKCKKFEIQVNPSKGYEWVIRKWALKWRAESCIIDSELEDRIAVAKHLESIGKYYTFIVYDGNQQVAGATLVRHRSSLVAGVNYRSPEYNSYGVGSYLYEHIFKWAAKYGYRDLDIGGGMAYKRLWAPVAGAKYEFTVSPVWAHRRQVIFKKMWRSFNRMDTSLIDMC
jgi:GNAT superfamily N-acetyltransferase